MNVRIQRVCGAVAALIAVGFMTGATATTETEAAFSLEEAASLMTVCRDAGPSGEPEPSCLAQWVAYWREIQAGNPNAKPPDCEL